MVRVISREIIFEVFQPMWSRYQNATDRQTDRQTTYNLTTALCVACAVKMAGKQYVGNESGYTLSLDSGEDGVLGLEDCKQTGG